MRILLDTNLFILREDYAIIDDNIQELLRLLNKAGCIILIHPKSVEEIKKDRDEERKQVILSKIGTYSLLKNPPNPKEDDYFESTLGKVSKIENEHDLNDLCLVYSVYRNAVQFLISEDKGVHSKASQLGISDRIFNIIDAITFFNDILKPPKKVYSPPAIEKKPLHNLKLEDSFFDSLREDYGEHIFNKWFRKKAQEGKEAYVYLNNDNSLGAFLLLKEEEEIIKANPIFLQKKRRLKISTLKVTNVGNKIGELFLSLAFNYAIRNNINELYLTHFIKENDRLIPLIKPFGFEKNSNYIEHNHTPKRESIFTKRIFPDEIEPIGILREKYFPCFYDGESVNKFIVPIIPEYHERLFIDIKQRQTKITEFLGDFITEGNTLQKAYLCNAPSKQMRKNDILLFYRSRKNQALTSLGTIDSIYYNLSKVDEIFAYVVRRTVYSKKEIQNFKKPLTVILFRFHLHLPREISYNELINRELLKMAPITTIKLNHKNYLKIKRLSKIDFKFTQWQN